MVARTSVCVAATASLHQYNSCLHHQLRTSNAANRSFLRHLHATKRCLFLAFPRAAVFVDTPPLIAAYHEQSEGGIMAANVRAAGAPAAQLAWLRSELKRATSACAATVVVGHHPVYSGGDHGSSPDLIASLEPLFAEFGVDGYVAGHDHMLGHLVWPPLEAGATSSNEGDHSRSNGGRDSRRRARAGSGDVVIHSGSAPSVGLSSIGDSSALAADSSARQDTTAAGALPAQPRYATDYFVNGAGSAIRDWWRDVPQAQWHLNANGFMAHSVNTSHIRHSFVSLAARDVVYSVTRRLKHAP
jgi:hypothetical protein